jgi:hypothetical protein
MNEKKDNCFYRFFLPTIQKAFAIANVSLRGVRNEQYATGYFSFLYQF